MRSVHSMRILQALAITLAVIAATGCGGGSTTPPPPTQATRAAARINVGDAPADGIVAFEITVNTVVLHGSAGDVSALAAPTRIELMHNSGTFEPLSLSNIPAGTYTGATVTVSNPEVKIIDSTGHAVELSTTLATGTAQVAFSPSITAGTDPIVINLDFNVAASVAISGNTATVTPTFSATTSTVAANEAEQEDEDGEVEATGAVNNVSGNSFTIAMEQSSQMLTFTTDSSTEFESPLANVASLATGMIVEVHAVTQSDGTLLAKKVDGENEDANGMEAEGLVVSTTGSPVTQFVAVVQDESSSSSTMPALGSNLTVNVDGNTKFIIHTHDVDLSNLPFTPAFGATTLVAGQRVEADTDSPDSTTITAKKLII
jgi:hypothetical protein